MSNRDGPGIYVVPAFGGDERLLVRDGQFPRFSPDGNWIAYCTTGNWLQESKLFVIPAAGGTPRQLAADAGWAGAPVWAPDSKRVLFLGMVGVNNLDKAQFWLAPIDGGRSVETNLLQLLGRERILPPGMIHWSGSSCDRDASVTRRRLRGAFSGVGCDDRRGS